MTIYVDNECISWKGKQWCHLVADSLAELHEFAQQLGLRRSWFQEQSVYPHYDITITLRDKALTLGALMGNRHTIISCAKRLKAELHLEKQASGQSLESTYQGTLFHASAS